MVINMNPRVYLLARLVGQSKMKFKMWCKYHETIGFRKIYIFLTEEPEWLQEVKKEIIEESDRFVFIKCDERWKKVSEIVKAFCKHCGNGDWGIILSTDEYIYTEKRDKFNVGNLVGYVIQRLHARSVTLYKEYVRENDGFEFKAKNYDTYSMNDSKFPVSSTLLFSVQDVNSNPLSSPCTPASQAQWIDSRWQPINKDILSTQVPRFSECAVRVIKLLDKDAVDEESESSFNEKASAFWHYYLYKFPEITPRFPPKANKVKEDTEAKLFEITEEAKQAVPVDEKIEYNLDGELIGRVIASVLNGNDYAKVVEDIHDARLPVSDDAIKIVYERECYNIIEGSESFQRLLRMLSDGIKQQTIMKELHVSPKNLKKWRTMLENIPAEIKAKFDTVSEATQVSVEEDVIPMSEKEKFEKKPKKKGGKKKKSGLFTVEDIDNGVQPDTKNCPVEEIPTDSKDE
jgi:hypothetical protein